VSSLHPGAREARHELVEKLRARGIEAIQGNAAAPEAIPRLRPPASAPS
jgi:methylmalonyl-CoA mutase cobalamin-binding subunit